MSLSDQFNDYVKWCKKIDPKPKQTDIGPLQTKFGLSGKLTWKFTDGTKLPADSSATIFMDVGKIEKFTVDLGPPFGKVSFSVVVSLKGGGFFQQGPATPQGIPFDSFELELLKPGDKDTIFFNLVLSGLDFSGGDSASGTLKMKNIADNPDPQTGSTTLTGSTKTKKGKAIAFALKLDKGSQIVNIGI